MGGFFITSEACTSFDLEDTISILAKQQFYFGQDRIYGRIKSISVKIKGSGLVVHRLITTLLNESPLFFKFKFDEYLHNIVKLIKFLDYETIYSKFSQKAAMLESNEANIPILITFLVGDLLSALREPAFDKVKQIIKKKALEKISSQSEMEKYFDKLCSLNNPHLSLLENLSFLDILSDAFHFKRVQRVIGIQLTKHVNFALQDLLTLYADNKKTPKK